MSSIIFQKSFRSDQDYNGFQSITKGFSEFQGGVQWGLQGSFQKVFRGFQVFNGDLTGSPEGFGGISRG